jgi:hypothetical protein
MSRSAGSISGNTTVYGQRVTSLTPGTILPNPMLTAKAVRPVRDQAR